MLSRLSNTWLEYWRRAFDFVHDTDTQDLDHVAWTWLPQSTDQLEIRGTGVTEGMHECGFQHIKFILLVLSNLQ